MTHRPAHESSQTPTPGFDHESDIGLHAHLRRLARQRREESKVEVDSIQRGRYLAYNGELPKIFATAERDSSILTYPQLVDALYLQTPTQPAGTEIAFGEKRIRTEEYHTWPNDEFFRFYPELPAGLNDSCISRSEENVGIDTAGAFLQKGEQAYVAVHGPGLLTIAKLEATYDEYKGSGQENNLGIAYHSEKEFSTLLAALEQGRLPGNEPATVITTKNILHADPDVWQEHIAVVLPHSAIVMESDYEQTKYMEHLLNDARFAGRKNTLAFKKKLEEYGIVQHWSCRDMRTYDSKGTYKTLPEEPFGQLLMVCDRVTTSHPRLDAGHARIIARKHAQADEQKK